MFYSVIIIMISIFFFFSSRRRHTRFDCDWSSDVCSSDLKVEGTQLKDEHGNAVVLRGMSYGWHNWWPRFYNAGTVKWLATDWKCNVIRAAMGVEPDEGYQKKPEWSTETIKKVVDAAIKENIYVIIDWHSHGIQLEEAKKFFTEMAKTYGKNPHVIYEIFNEPDYESWADVKNYSVRSEEHT